MLALRQVARAQGGIAEIARKAKLTREATYKMLSKSGDPELRNLKAVLAATGLRIAESRWTSGPLDRGSTMDG